MSGLTGEWGRARRDDLLERWPKDERGEPERAALLCTCGNLDMCDDVIVNMLEAYGIPSFRRYPGNGSFGRVVLGVSGEGVEIYVPESLREDAEKLCNEENGEDEL